MQTARPAALPPAVIASIQVQARRLRGRAFHADVRDLEQDAYVACLMALRRYDGRTKLVTFLRRRLVGGMIDGLRRWDNRRDGRKVEWVPLSHAVTNTVQSRDRSADTEILATELRASIDALPYREAYVLQGLFFDDAGYDELAHELGVSKSQVWLLRRQGLDRLRKLL